MSSIGNITNPFIRLGGPAGLANSTSGSGLIVILSNLFRTAIVVAGVYALLNFILAGYAFMSAGGEPKNITKAWEKIWQSILGLLIITGSLVLAVVIGFLLYGGSNATILIRPIIFGP